jgi:uncharacterized membrane protein (Fun14 family)
MTTLTDFAPLAGSVGGGFFIGMLVRYAIKKVIRIAAVIVGLFIAALAYLEYQKIINVDWIRVQSVSQNGITWIADSLTHISNNIGASHTGKYWDPRILFHLRQYEIDTNEFGVL